MARTSDQLTETEQVMIGELDSISNERYAYKNVSGVWTGAEITGLTGYTITNDTEIRTLDCDSTNINELADVLGTLIGDISIIGATTGLTWGDSITDSSGTGVTITLDNTSATGTRGLDISSGTSSNIVTGLALDCGSYEMAVAGSASMFMHTYGSGTTPNKTGGIYSGINCNTNSSTSFENIILFNEDNAGSGINTGMSITNKYTTSNGSGAGVGMNITQNGVDGTAYSLTTGNNINSTTYGLVNYTLSNSQSGASTIQKINTGTSTQDHLVLHLTGTRFSMQIDDSDQAPGTTTNKLYAVGGNLFWNGTQLN